MLDDLHRTVVLRDGTRVVVRPIRPSDENELREGLRRLSPRARYLRFHSLRSELTDSEWRYLTEVDFVRHVAVVAETDGREGRYIAAVARFVGLEEPRDVADAAVVVIDHMQGKGLGAALLDVLIEAAQARGFRGCRVDVLPENRVMRKLLARPRLVRVAEREGRIDLRLREAS